MRHTPMCMSHTPILHSDSFSEVKNAMHICTSKSDVLTNLEVEKKISLRGWSCENAMQKRADKSTVSMHL